MLLINITIKTFDPFFLKKAINNIKKLCQVLDIKKIIVFSLAPRIKKYTVARSPHIDKKSREQFEIKKYKTKIELRIKNKITTEIFEILLKNSTYPGVEIALSKEFFEYLPKGLQSELQSPIILKGMRNIPIG